MEYELRQVLLRETGLDKLVVNYENFRGVKFNWNAQNSSFKVDFTNIVFISTDQIERVSIDLAVPLSDAFISVVAHELGHLEAYLRHLDWVDELVAWEMAEELLNGKVGSSWKWLKDNQINHPENVWYTRRRLLDHNRLLKPTDLRVCLECGVVNDCQIFPAKQHVCNESSGLMHDCIIEYVFRCPGCLRQFRARVKDRQVTAVWELAGADYSKL